MTDQPRLDPPVGKHLADPFAEEAMAKTWATVRRGRLLRAGRRARIRVAASTVAVLGVVAVAVWALGAPAAPVVRDRTHASPIACEGGAPFVGLGPGQSVVLEDRTRIVTGEDGELEILANRPDAISLHLVRGRVRFEITPHGPRTWRIEGGGLEIEVVGTVFEVDRHGARVRVSVERGVVLVRGESVADGVRRLEAGESLQVGPEEVGPEEVGPEEVGAVGADVIEEAPATRHEVRAEDGPVAETHAREPRPLPSSRAMLAEADALRRAGDETGAREVLRDLVDQHPRAPEAPIAAFTLAQLLSRRGDATGAQRFYELALALGLDGPLADEARAQLLAADHPTP